jgi:vanillate O-demethylase monooxygenase subunit
MKYLDNAWYAAAWSGEVSREPLVRTLLDEPVLLYRTQAGQAVAMTDRCPHRFAPLHQGRLLGDAIQCPYHGLRFDAHGACVDNPIGSGFIPARARLRTFPLAERNGIVWLWFGDEPAEERSIVAFDFLDDRTAYDCVDGYMTIDANYAMISDNLLDLSHAEFLHPKLSSPGSNKRVKLTVEQQANTVHARNWRASEPTTVLLRMAFGEPCPDIVDMWSDVRWDPPAVLCVEVGATAVGGNKDDGVNTLTAHLVTPETERRSHYFWRMARSFRRGDADFDGVLATTVQAAFHNEDKPIIEAQQRYMGARDITELAPVLLESDAAAVRARRIMSRLLQSQSKSETAA